MSDDQSKIVALPTAEDLDTEAAAWLVALGHDDVSEKHRRDFQDWLEISDRHRKAFIALAKMWDEMAVLEELPDIAAGAPVEERALFASPGSRRWFAMAASIALILGFGGLWNLTDSGFAEPEKMAWTTALGEQKTINLSDGSVIQLNTKSAASVELTDDLRLVRLTSGEAHFDVAKDPARPFRVISPNGIVEAIGTAFSVRLLDDKSVEVLVDEGVVALEPIEPKELERMISLQGRPVKAAAHVTAGEKAVFGAEVKQITAVPVRELEQELSWRTGMLTFSGEPLSEVVAEVSRYADIQIEIADSAIASRPVGGYFPVGDTGTLFESLELSFGVKVERIDERHVRLVAKAR